MAEKVIAIKMTLDTSETVQGLDKVDQGVKNVDSSVDELNQSTNNLTFDDKLQQINDKVKSGELDFRQLRKTIQDYQGIALQAGRTSPVGQEALAQAAALKDQMVDLDNEVKRLADDGVALKGAMQIGQGVVAGFTAVKGVTAALGVENEDLQKTMVQLQGAQAALMGIEQLRATFLEKESFAAILLNNTVEKARALLTGELTLKTIALSAAEKARTVATKAATIAQAAMNFVMNLNPIGIIILLIAGLVAGFLLLRDKIDIIVEKFFNLNTIMLLLLGPIGLLILAYQQFYGEQAQLQEEQDKQLREAQINERKRHEERLKQIDKEKDEKIAAADETIKALELEKDTLEAQGKKSTEVALKMLEAELSKKQAVLDANQEKIQSYIDYYTNLAQLRGQDEQEFKDSLKTQGIDLDQLQQKANDIIAENERNVQFSQNKITKFKREQNEKSAANEKKHQQEITKIKEDELKKQLALEEKQLKLEQKLRELRIGNIKNADERELELLKNKQEKERLALEKQFGSNTALEKELMIKHENEMLAFQEKINAKKLEAEHQFQLMKAEMIKAEAEKDFQKQEEEKAKLDANIEKIQGFVQLAGEVNEVLNEISERRKAKIQEDSDKELSELEKSKKAQLAVEGLSERQKQDIEKKSAMAEFKIKKESAEAQDKIAKKQFNRNKAQKLAEIAINTAAGIVQALASAPPPLSFATAAITGGIGAAQLALVASTKFKGTAGSISPPSFSAPSDTSSGSSGSGGNDTPQSNLQNDTGTAIGLNGQISVSQVEINETQGTLANIEDVSTIGG
jgi:hypothetical protein